MQDRLSFHLNLSEKVAYPAYPAASDPAYPVIRYVLNLSCPGG